MEYYSYYNINKLFIFIIDQTIIKHSDKFINYNDSFPAMMDTAEELLDEVRNKILGERQIELDENELEHMGRRGRIYVENNFSSDIVASKMLGIYEKYSKK